MRAFLILGATAALAPTTGAQDLVVRSATVGATGINGVMPTGEGTAYATSETGELWLVELADLDATMLLAGLPLSAPGKGVVVQGHPWLDDGLVLCDWNSVDDAPCCEGRTWLIDPDTLEFTTLAEGAPTHIVADPIAPAIAPGGAWGDDVYVANFEGASPELPTVFRITPQGPEPFLQDGALWGVNDEPEDLAFDVSGDYAGDLFVMEAFSSGDPEKIVRVEPDASWSLFFQDAQLGEPRAITFGGGGDFGNWLYALFAQGNEGTIYRISPDAVAEPIVDGLCSDGTGKWDLAYDPSFDALVAATGSAMHVIGYGDPGCYPDCNADGTLNILDFVCFQAAFLAGEIEADCNHDCAYSILDFVCFQERFLAGCT